MRWEGFRSLAVNRRVHVKRSSNGKACCLLLTYWAAVGYQPKTKPVWSIILSHKIKMARGLYLHTLVKKSKETFLSHSQMSLGGGGLVAKSCPTLVTPWTVACQAPLSMGFSRKENWSGLPFPSPDVT